MALAVGAMLLLVSACGGSASGDSKDGGKAKPGASASQGGKGDTTESQAVVTIAPEDGADEVATTGDLKVTAGKGKLTSVVVKSGKGDPVEGKISTDGSSWEPTETLGTSTKYSVDAIAKDGAGRESAKHASFTTVTPKDTFIGFFTPEDGQTVGVGMPVSLKFNRAITDKQAVQDAIKVTANPSVPVVGHWYGDQRVDFRPEKYWAKGTKITLSLRLNGVEAAKGVYGTQSKDVHYTIGRSQVSIVDAAKHTMKVYRDGKLTKTIPITSGGPGTTTYNGKMVITERYKVTRMNGDTVGFGGEYDIKDVPNAQRLTTSGTFIHGNYWASPGTFGNSNVSHGCVGLRDVRGGNGDTPSSWFYNNSMIGDVVEVRNSHDKTVQWWNGLNGWNLPWSQWTPAS
ncbi:Lipoprotein-anchoring transpeptidase ErfK/SrfK [Actinacidiphila glaucinigra]|uniref:Lipoprotein-anchoring transpeptidase ErfK/SrfK n=2 Tax=Actinacidiphila glaucinigra TaxID=235986 RepID=A0A239H7S6_9ACTN|nr:Lipoprotein-anchoring transpeptidase ErfK/SrfK [Actinacidiphila glaucinigra]